MNNRHNFLITSGKLFISFVLLILYRVIVSLELNTEGSGQKGRDLDRVLTHLTHTHIVNIVDNPPTIHVFWLGKKTRGPWGKQKAWQDHAKSMHKGQIWESIPYCWRWEAIVLNTNSPCPLLQEKYFNSKMFLLGNMLQMLLKHRNDCIFLYNNLMFTAFGVTQQLW